MDNALQVLPTLLSMLAAVVQLISAFYYAATAYMRGRRANFLPVRRLSNRYRIRERRAANPHSSDAVN